jgi:endonuclease YncB( thermonuclease family)
MTRRRKATRVLLVSILTGLVAFLQQQGYIEKLTTTATSNQPGLYRVTTFTDGDTITVDMNGVEEKVRFIGVDTPETHDPRKSVQCYGQAAAAFTKNYIGANRVRLTADPENSNRDRYGRLLRYVYLPSGELVNAEIIKQGYGFAYVYFPFSKMEEFKSYQKTAEQQQLGLWGDCPISTDVEGQSRTN